eukprot:gene14035-21467_t
MEAFRARKQRQQQQQGEAGQEAGDDQAGKKDPPAPTGAPSAKASKASRLGKLKSLVGEAKADDDDAPRHTEPPPQPANETAESAADSAAIEAAVKKVTVKFQREIKVLKDRVQEEEELKDTEEAEVRRLLGLNAEIDAAATAKRINAVNDYAEEAAKVLADEKALTQKIRFKLRDSEAKHAAFKARAAAARERFCALLAEEKRLQTLARCYSKLALNRKPVVIDQSTHAFTRTASTTLTKTDKRKQVPKKVVPFESPNQTLTHADALSETPVSTEKKRRPKPVNLTPLAYYSDHSPSAYASSGGKPSEDGRQDILLETAGGDASDDSSSELLATRESVDGPRERASRGDSPQHRAHRHAVSTGDGRSSQSEGALVSSARLPGAAGSDGCSRPPPSSGYRAFDDVPTSISSQHLLRTRPAPESIAGEEDCTTPDSDPSRDQEAERWLDGIGLHGDSPDLEDALLDEAHVLDETVVRLCIEAALAPSDAVCHEKESAAKLPDELVSPAVAGSLSRWLAREWASKPGSVLTELVQNLSAPKRNKLQVIAWTAVVLQERSELDGYYVLELFVMALYTMAGSDIDALMGYRDAPTDPASADWDRYIPRNGAMFRTVNSAMRAAASLLAKPGAIDETGYPWTDLRRWVKTIMVLASASNRATGDFALTRGLTGLPKDIVAAHKKLAEGDAMVWPAPSSCALDPTVSWSYVLGSATNSVKKTGGAIMFEVTSGCGVPLQSVSRYPKETEVLLPPLSELEVQRVKQGGGVVMVEATIRPNGHAALREATDGARDEAKRGSEFLDAACGDVSKAALLRRYKAAKGLRVLRGRHTEHGRRSTGRSPPGGVGLASSEEGGNTPHGSGDDPEAAGAGAPAREADGESDDERKDSTDRKGSVAPPEPAGQSGGSARRRGTAELIDRLTESIAHPPATTPGPAGASASPDAPPAPKTATPSPMNESPERSSESSSSSPSDSGRPSPSPPKSRGSKPVGGNADDERHAQADAIPAAGILAGLGLHDENFRHPGESRRRRDGLKKGGKEAKPGAARGPVERELFSTADGKGAEATCRRGPEGSADRQTQQHQQLDTFSFPRVTPEGRGRSESVTYWVSPISAGAREQHPQQTPADADSTSDSSSKTSSSSSSPGRWRSAHSKGASHRRRDREKRGSYDPTPHPSYTYLDGFQAQGGRRGSKAIADLAARRRIFDSLSGSTGVLPLDRYSAALSLAGHGDVDAGPAGVALTKHGAGRPLTFATFSSICESLALAGEPGAGHPASRAVFSGHVNPSYPLAPPAGTDPVSALETFEKFGRLPTVLHQGQGWHDDCRRRDTLLHPNASDPASANRSRSGAGGAASPPSDWLGSGAGRPSLADARGLSAPQVRQHHSQGMPRGGDARSSGARSPAELPPSLAAHREHQDTPDSWDRNGNPLAEDARNSFANDREHRSSGGNALSPGTCRDDRSTADQLLLSRSRDQPSMQGYRNGNPLAEDARNSFANDREYRSSGGNAFSPGAYREDRSAADQLSLSRSRDQPSMQGHRSGPSHGGEARTGVAFGQRGVDESAQPLAANRAPRDGGAAPLLSISRDSPPEGHRFGFNGTGEVRSGSSFGADHRSLGEHEQQAGRREHHDGSATGRSFSANSRDQSSLHRNGFTRSGESRGSFDVGEKEQPQADRREQQDGSATGRSLFSNSRDQSSLHRNGFVISGESRDNLGVGENGQPPAAYTYRSHQDPGRGTGPFLSNPSPHIHYNSFARSGETRDSKPIAEHQLQAGQLGEKQLVTRTASPDASQRAHSSGEQSGRQTHSVVIADRRNSAVGKTSLVIQINESPTRDHHQQQPQGTPGTRIAYQTSPSPIHRPGGDFSPASDEDDILHQALHQSPLAPLPTAAPHVVRSPRGTPVPTPQVSPASPSRKGSVVVVQSGGSANIRTPFDGSAAHGAAAASANRYTKGVFGPASYSPPPHPTPAAEERKAPARGPVSAGGGLSPDRDQRAAFPGHRSAKREHPANSTREHPSFEDVRVPARNPSGVPPVPWTPEGHRAIAVGPDRVLWDGGGGGGGGAYSPAFTNLHERRAGSPFGAPPPPPNTERGDTSPSASRSPWRGPLDSVRRQHPGAGVKPPATYQQLHQRQVQQQQQRQHRTSPDRTPAKAGGSSFDESSTPGRQPSAAYLAYLQQLPLPEPRAAPPSSGRKQARRGEPKKPAATTPPRSSSDPAHAAAAAREPWDSSVSPPRRSPADPLRPLSANAEPARTAAGRKKPRADRRAPAALEARGQRRRRARREGSVADSVYEDSDGTTSGDSGGENLAGGDRPMGRDAVLALCDAWLQRKRDRNAHAVLQAAALSPPRSGGLRDTAGRPHDRRRVSIAEAPPAVASGDRPRTDVAGGPGNGSELPDRQPYPPEGEPGGRAPSAAAASLKPAAARATINTPPPAATYPSRAGLSGGATFTGGDAIHPSGREAGRRGLRDGSTVAQETNHAPAAGEAGGGRKSDGTAPFKQESRSQPSEVFSGAPATANRAGDVGRPGEGACPAKQEHGAAYRSGRGPSGGVLSSKHEISDGMTDIYLGRATGPTNTTVGTSPPLAACLSGGEADGGRHDAEVSFNRESIVHTEGNPADIKSSASTRSSWPGTGEKEAGGKRLSEEAASFTQDRADWKPGGKGLSEDTTEDSLKQGLSRRSDFSEVAPIAESGRRPDRSGTWRAEARDGVAEQPVRDGMGRAPSDSLTERESASKHLSLSQGSRDGVAATVPAATKRHNQNGAGGVLRPRSLTERELLSRQGQFGGDSAPAVPLAERAPGGTPVHTKSARAHAPTLGSDMSTELSPASRGVPVSDGLSPAASASCTSSAPRKGAGLPSDPAAGTEQVPPIALGHLETQYPSPWPAGTEQVPPIALGHLETQYPSPWPAGKPTTDDPPHPLREWAGGRPGVVGPGESVADGGSSGVTAINARAPVAAEGSESDAAGAAEDGDFFTIRHHKAVDPADMRRLCASPIRLRVPMLPHGVRVTLVASAESDGCLMHGEIGVIVDRDEWCSRRPLCVKGPRYDVHWYKEADLTVVKR